MLRRLIKKNDPNHSLLGPTLWGLESWGMWQPENSKKRYFYNAIHITAILFVFSQYVDLWLIRHDLEKALKNLSFTMLSTVCVVKAATFVSWQKEWSSIIHFVSNLEKDQLKSDDPITKRIIDVYTSYSRKVTYFYWSLVMATVVTVTSVPFVSVLIQKIKNSAVESKPEIMSSWMPFDKTSGYGYWATILEHTLIVYYGGGIVANYDTNAVVLMTFFAGQLDVLAENCARLFDFENDDVDFNLVMERIRKCHYHHIFLVRYSKIMNSLLSPVMFLYIIICSLMICACAFQLTTDNTTSMHRIWITEYLMALIAQLFLYCWHSNQVLHMSNKAEDGVYRSAWYLYNKKVRRSVLLLGGQLRKSIVFSAGPFNQLTVATFVAILKGSYSFYTLLSKKED